METHGYFSCQYSELQEVDFITDQLRNPGRLQGYRYVKCQEHCLQVRKDYVRLILAELDPVICIACWRRRLNRRQYFSQGPNYI